MAISNIGKDGFSWFVGVVEDRDDPLRLGRVKVRVHNVHTENKVLLKTNELPWASVLNPINSASLKNVGISPTGMAVGTTVVGFFMDGNDSNLPVVMGTLVGIPDNKQDNHDVPKEARGINSINKELTGPEPASAYGAKYPYNKVVRTEKGHIIEIDDTPDKERIHIYHKSGTYTEVNKDGRKVSKVVNDDFDIVIKNKEVYVGGNVNIKVKGNVTLTVDGNMNSTVGGTYSVKSGGVMTFRAPKINLN
jgi:hypothetical protein